jgi:hypothetical protein
MPRWYGKGTACGEEHTLMLNGGTRTIIRVLGHVLKLVVRRQVQLAQTQGRKLSLSPQVQTSHPVHTLFGGTSEHIGETERAVHLETTMTTLRYG